MLLVRIVNPVPTNMCYTHISLYCNSCGHKLSWYRRPSESLGLGLRDRCPKCTTTLPTLDYLIADSPHIDDTAMRILNHGGRVI